MCKPGTASLPGDCAGVWRWVPQRTCCAPFGVIARLDRAIQYPTTVRESPNLCLQRWGYWIARLKGAMTTMGVDQPQRPFGLDPSLWRPVMQENFRQFLDRLRQTGELVDLHQPVDIRHISTLVDQADTALFFHNVVGYDMPVVSGIIRSRERAAMALGCDTYLEIEHKLKAAIDQPIPPKHVKSSPTREVTLVGDDVDLYKLPIPMSSIYDGGPMITARV